jgi:HEAT repeat protein
VALAGIAVIVLFYMTHDRTPTYEERSRLRNHFPQTPRVSEESLTRERGVALENESTPAIPTEISKKVPVVPSKRITEEEPFISVTDNRLTLWIQGRRLGWVLDQIARQSGIPIFHDEGIANQVLSMTLQDTALDEGLREILSGYDVFILYGGEQVAPVAIWVYPEGKGRQLLPVPPELWASTPEMEQQLGDPDPDLRAQAIETLIQRRGPQSLEAVLQALEDPQDTVRSRALDAAANHAVELPEDTLAHLTQLDPSPQVRFLALTALAADLDRDPSNNADLRAISEYALNDASPHVRVQARQILETLNRALSPPEPEAPQGEPQT